MNELATNFTFAAKANSSMNQHQIKHILIWGLLLFTIQIQAQQKALKHNYNLGVIPVSSYDADLGFKYGAVVNLFDYAPQKADYSQYLLLRLTNTTRNTLNIQSVFESEQLIPNATTIIEAGYTNDQKLNFYGFNGIESNYNPNIENSKSAEFIHQNFYTLDRKLIRFRADIQKNISQNWRTLTGITFSKFILQSNSEENSTTLYDNYLNWGIIDTKEEKGGSVLNLKFGMVYDSRNDKCTCTSGQWFEGFIVYAPPISDLPAFSKMILTYRYYHSLNENFTLTFRLSSQTKLSGKVPHYMLPIYFDSQLNQDGLGGAYTMRGISRNRIMADGFALGNFETRIKLKEFTFFKLDFLISATLFTDVAYITQPYDYKLKNIPLAQQNQFFSNSQQPLYIGLGPGLNIIYNQNNITTINYGFSPNPQMGNGGLYIGSRFLF
ncbi:MAG: hypothetical protein PF541_18220 [Prolixibacteraceae bacterium]|nr:hypothetical protein [Prolixibacteraceae bacterium]